jgi:hypothetical protein
MMSVETLTETVVQKIREEVLAGKSRWRVAIDTGVNFYLVDFYTKDLPYKRRTGREQNQTIFTPPHPYPPPP